MGGGPSSSLFPFVSTAIRRRFLFKLFPTKKCPLSVFLISTIIEDSVVSEPDVHPCDEAEEVPLHRELLFRSQPGGEGRLDVHEEQQL